MPCFKPLTMYRQAGTEARTFDKKSGTDMGQQIPCGQCRGCRKDKNMEWAIRCMHEAQMHPQNCFVTLTYDKEHLPPDKSLDRKAITLFIRRLRRKYPRYKIRYYGAGEYGDRTYRPHYHVLIFGFDFPDKRIYSRNGNYKMYTSEQLSEVWPYGYATLGSVTLASAFYTAKYVQKKLSPGQDLIDAETGAILEKEFAVMSRMPGIGKAWFDRYHMDVFPHDHCIHEGKKVKTPKYYLNQLEKMDLEKFEYVKEARKEKSRQQSMETLERLETCADVRAKSFPQKRKSI